MMVLDAYLLKKNFLALQNLCIQFPVVTTVVISECSSDEVFRSLAGVSRMDRVRNEEVVRELE